MPIVVVAPLLIVWFGFGIAPKLAIIALVCFFPVVVTTLDALAAVDPEQRKLLRTLDASRRQELRWVEIPAALPGALAGAKIAVAIAVIGAVFAEYAGSSEGLGNVILQAIPQLETARAYAAVALLAALAILLFALLALAERLLVPWARRRPRTEPCMTRRKALAVLTAALAVAVALGAERLRQARGARPGRPQPRQLTLVLDYLPNADHVGIYMAQARGEFRKAGLDVKIVTPSDPAAPLKLLAAGPRRPRDLLRARDPARARQGPRGPERRRARPAAADLADGRQGPLGGPEEARRASASGPPGSPTRRPTSTRSSQNAGVDPATRQAA